MTVKTDLLTETADLFVKAHRLLDPVRLQLYEAMNLTLPQIKIMAQVEARPGLNGRALADSLGITASAVSQHVERLVKRGLLTRTGDLDDRRRVVLELTPEGQRALADVHQQAHDLAAKVLTPLAGPQLEALNEVLTRLLAAQASEPLA